jgi:hypothetical protein
MKRKELIAQILTEIKKYDESGLVDYISLNRWIKNELKRFGENLMEMTGKVIRVENGQATLPDNFYSLHFAVHCTPECYKIEGDKEIVQSSHFYRERLETLNEWDNQSNSYNQISFTTIEDKFMFQDNSTSVRVRYKDPILMKPVKGIKRDLLFKGCKNMKVIKSPYEFNIVGEKVHVNFKEGDIFIHYYSYPSDENGDLIIPENRNLEEYLIAFCKWRILEGMWLNDDDTNIITKLQYFQQQAQNLYGLAQTQVKFESLNSSNWAQRIRNNNAKESMKYERMFPN